MKTKMSKIGNFAFIIATLFGSVSQAAPTISARLSADQISINDTVTLSIEITEIDIQPPTLNIADFSVQSAGQTKSFQWINGQTSSLVAFNYVLTPLKSGALTVPALTLQHNGQTYSTQPLSVTVRDEAARAPATSGPAATNVPTEGLKPVFLTAAVDRSKVYVGQQVLLTIQFLRRPNVDLASRPRYVEPDMNGFVVEPLKQQEFNTELNGVPYAVTELRYALFPTSDGDFAIGSAGVDVALRGAWDPFDPNSFFQNFFGQGQVAKLKTRAIPVHVRALPKNRPDQYTGAVGRYKLNATVDTKEPEVGKPFNLSLKIEGVGNIKAIKEPALPDITGIRRYETITNSTVNNEGKFLYGKKEFKVLMMPQVSGAITLPSVTFTYFDPEEHQYRSATTTPISLNVKQGTLSASNADLPPVADVAPAEGIRVMEKDIRFIKTGSLHPIDRPMIHRIGFWTLAAFPPIMAFGGFLTTLRNRERSRRSTYYRAKEAWSRCRKGLKKARKIVETSDPIPFFTALHGSVLGYLADKMGQSPSGLLWSDVETFLSEKSISNEEVQRLRTLWDEIDLARFSTFEPVEDRSNLLTQAENLLRDLDKKL